MGLTMTKRTEKGGLLTDPASTTEDVKFWLVPEDGGILHHPARIVYSVQVENLRNIGALDTFRVQVFANTGREVLEPLNVSVEPGETRTIEKQTLEHSGEHHPGNSFPINSNVKYAIAVDHNQDGNPELHELEFSMGHTCSCPDDEEIDFKKGKEEPCQDTF